jgi:hypothetical protein
VSAAFQFDQNAFMGDVAKIMKIQGRAFEDVITEQTRSFVRDALSITRPFGREPMAEGTSIQKAVGLRAVMRDTKRAFRSIETVDMIKENAGLLDVLRHTNAGGPVSHSGAHRKSKPSSKQRNRKPNDKIGAAIMRCHRAGAITKQNDLIFKSKLNPAGVVDVPTKQLHYSLREYEGGVPKKRSFLVMANTKTVEAFGKELQKNVGLGKSGWVTAANALLAGTGSSNLLRRKMGAWITRHKSDGVFTKEGQNTDRFGITVGNGVQFIQKDKLRVDKEAWNTRNHNIRKQVAMLEKWSRDKMNADPLTRGSVS